MECSKLMKESLYKLDSDNIAEDIKNQVSEYTDKIKVNTNVLKRFSLEDYSVDPVTHFGSYKGLVNNESHGINRENPIKEIFTDTGYNSIDRDMNYSKYYDAIEGYTRYDFKDVVAPMRDNKQVNHSILKFLQEEPENFDGVVYRGTRVTPKTIKQLEALTPGDIISNKTPLSTTVDFDTARQFITYNYKEHKIPLMLTIEGKGHDIAHASVNFDEAEVLLKPNKKYVIVSKYISPVQAHLVIKEIPREISDTYKLNIKHQQLLGLGGLTLIANSKEN